MTKTSENKKVKTRGKGARTSSNELENATKCVSMSMSVLLFSRYTSPLLSGAYT